MRLPVLVALILASTVVAGCSTASFSDSRALTGTWSGSYTCSQGLTGLTMEVTGNYFGAVTATVDFYEVPANPGVPSGRYIARGLYTGERTLLLEADETDWVVKPDGYRTVDFDGSVSSDAATFSGNVIGSAGCLSFSVAREP